MTNFVVRQALFALTAGASALVSIESSAQAFAKARDLSFEGSWLMAAGAVLFAIVALWLTCLGALRSDRRDRYRSGSGSDRSGPVYTDIDGYMQVH